MTAAGAPPTASPDAPRARVVRPRTLRSVVSNWIAFVFSVGVGFFMSPFTVHHLGTTQYGIWVLLVSMVGYMGLLDLGVRGAVMYYVARNYALGEDGAAGRAASTGLVFFGGLGAVSILLSGAAALIVDRLFNIPPELVPAARTVLVIGGTTVAISLVSGVFGGIIAGLQRFDRLAAADVSVASMRTILVISALLSGRGLVALAIIQLANNAVQLLVYRALSRSLYPELRVAPRSFDWPQLKGILSFGLVASALHISNALLYATDSFVIGAFLPVAMVTFFSIPSSLRAYSSQVISAISMPVTPRATALRAQSAEAGMRAVVLGMSALASVVVMPIAITLLIRGRSFIALWMGPTYAPVSGPLLAILSVPLLFAGVLQITASALVGVNEHRQLVPFYIAEAALNLSLSIYWIRSLGLTGVALGTTIPNVVTSALICPVLLRRVFGIRISDVWIATLVRPAVAMLPFAAGTWFVERHWRADNVFGFMAQVAVILPLAMAGGWVVALNADQKRAVAGIRMRMLNAVRAHLA